MTEKEGLPRADTEAGSVEESAAKSGPKRSLSWHDLVLTLAGIIVFYALVVVGTVWLIKRWPNETAVLYLNAFLTQAGFGLLILIIIKVRGWSWADLGWRRTSLRGVWGSVFRLYALTWVINILYVFFLYQHNLTPPDNDVYSKLLENPTMWTFVLNIILTVTLAPVVEETLFRGLVFSSLRSYLGKWTAAGISAAVFSGLHFQAYGFLPRFVLGLMLAHLYEKNRSIYPAIMLHALNNLVATTLMLVAT